MAIVLDVGIFLNPSDSGMLMLHSGQLLGWLGLVRVDGKTMIWMGERKDVETATQAAFEYTATRSIVTIEADDKVQVKITFLSPLTPNDFKRQSLVFSYMDVEVSSLDGSEHDVQIYTDISAGTSLCSL